MKGKLKRTQTFAAGMISKCDKLSSAAPLYGMLYLKHGKNGANILQLLFQATNDLAPPYIQNVYK